MCIPYTNCRSCWALLPVTDINVGKMLLYFVLGIWVCVRGSVVCSLKTHLAHITQRFVGDGCWSGIPNELMNI